MANRLILAFLALVASFAAQVAPSQARACTSAAVAVASEQRAAPSHVALAEGYGPETSAEARWSKARTLSLRLDFGAVAPTVYTGIDRARE